MQVVGRLTGCFDSPWATGVHQVGQCWGQVRWRTVQVVSTHTVYKYLYRVTHEMTFWVQYSIPWVIQGQTRDLTIQSRPHSNAILPVNCTMLCTITCTYIYNVYANIIYFSLCEICLLDNVYGVSF